MILPFAKWISRSFVTLVIAVPALGAGAASPVAAQQPSAFPSMHVWSMAGQFRDSSWFARSKAACQGLFPGAPPDSMKPAARAVTVRFLRDRTAEARPDFGGYRIYRMINTPDSSRAVLLRRYSINTHSELTWGFSRVDSAGDFICNDFLGNPQVVNDSIVTFVDPDSNGSYQKICNNRDPVTQRCLDSVFVQVAPPGPHDGFKTWYSITYEKRNTTDADYEDLFLPDTLDNWARCDTSGVRNTCPNLNNKLRNLAGPVEPTIGPAANLELAHAVPNPYRASEAWDPAGQGEVHFINLPKRATIKIFTVAGDLVRVIDHVDPVRDFERWDLRNGRGNSIASGIYMYRIESGTYAFQDRLIVIR